jgi:hypothetical protein
VPSKVRTREATSDFVGSDCELQGHGSDAAAIDDVKRSAMGEFIRPAVFRRALRATTVRQALDEKSRTDQHICARWSGLDLASLNHTRPRHYRLAIGRARALMCLSKDTVCRRRLLLFLLAGLLRRLLRLLSFLSHVALRYPKLVQCKSTSTCINIQYTTIAELILLASKKVNADHTIAPFGYP